VPHQQAQDPAGPGAGRPGGTTEAAEVPQGGGVPRHPTAGVRERGGRQARGRARHYARRDLFQGRKYKLVVRRSYQEDFQRAAARAGLPPEFIPHSLRHFYAFTALAEGIPITEVSRWLGHKTIEVTRQIYGHLVPSSFDRARTALDTAYHKSRRQLVRKPAA
jgi:integrase